MAAKVRAVTRPHGQNVVELVDRALARATNAPRIDGNDVDLLRDAAEHLPAWLAAIRNARNTIFLECYIFADDSVGREFAVALAERAQAGVAVFVIYDCLGSPRSGALWALLRKSGAEVRGFNPFRFDAPLEWLSRDHRKMLAVDGEIGFVTGLCLSARWLGNPAKRLEPWRDTGIAVRGPAVAGLEAAFAAAWRAAGQDPLPATTLTPVEAMPVAGEVKLRVVAGMPSAAGVLRLDQTVAGIAREYLWLTDAYFVGLTSYVQALCAAAQDGVDVRLLVPGASDIPLLRPLTRAGYRPLLAAGVRVFEWNGSMLHAKTAVADGAWTRIGSTNLNFVSLIQNWELDVAVEDATFAQRMADVYEDDLTRATEVVLKRRNRVGPTHVPPRAARRSRAGSAGRAAASAMTVGSALGAALTNRRVLGPAESGLLWKLGLGGLVFAMLALVWPRLVAVPLAVVAAWLGLATVWKGWRLRHKGGGSGRRRGGRRT